ncbi:MAG: helix-turn-helix domain-containing protein [Ktedonobacteraceae bacterium]|nr:helix-turn-helix domain-containing protein [Ktedonobacteraceae bacterium]
MRQFAIFLANLRSSAQLSLEELGTLVATSRTTISRLENNEVSQPFRGQTRKVVLALAEILCTSRIETERYLKLADIDRSLLTEIEEIQWPCQALHRLLDMEMHMFDEMNPQSDPAEHGISRRNALLALAMLPIGLLEVMQSHQQSASPEEFLPLCTASIAACWHLMAGREFEAIERAVTTYLPHLIRWAQQSSLHRPTALHLAAQGYLLMGAIALHKLAMPRSFQVRLAYCQQAVESARGSEDRTLLIMALAHVATAYYDMGQPTGVQAYQEAESLLTEQTAPLLRSKVFVAAARAYARFGQGQEALYRIGEARAIYPGIVADLPSFVTADSGLVPMILHEGLTYLALGQQEPEDYYAMAEKAFAQVEHVPTALVVPERFLCWITNNQALAAIKVNNLDDFERYFVKGIQGADALGSQKRRYEAIANWKEARRVWPNEKRVTELADLLM